MKRTVKVLAWIFVPFLAVLITLSLLLLLPSVQNFVTSKATQIISEKTGMEARIGSIYLGFPKTVELGDLFLADSKADTLLYCKQLDVDIELLPLLRQKASLDLLKIDGLYVNVYQNSPDSSYNFSPWIDPVSKDKNHEPPPTKSSWSVGFEEIELSNIKAYYNSYLDSSMVALNLGMLTTTANDVDLITGKFDLDKIDLQNTSISMTMAQGSDTTSQNDSLPLPYDINLEALNLADCRFDLQSVDGKFVLFTKTGSLNILPRQLDLATYNIDLDKLTADAIDVVLKITPSDSMEINDKIPLQEQNTNSPFTFGDIPWRVLVHQVDIANTNYKMDLGEDTGEKTRSMDYGHLSVQGIHFLADSIFFNKNTTGGNLKQLRAKEQSGAEIKKASGSIKMDNHAILARDMHIATDKSWVKGTASLGYAALDQIGKNMAQLQINADLKGNVHLKELEPFTPVAQDYPMLQKVENIGVKGIKIHGNLGDLTLDKSSLALGNTTTIGARGNIKGLPSSDLNIVMALDTLRTGAMDIAHILPDTLLPNGVRLPESMALSATFSYQKHFMDLGVFLSSDFGNASFSARQDNDSIAANFDLEGFDAGSLLGDSTYGKITMNGKLNGIGTTEKLHSLRARVDIDSLKFMENTYKSLHLGLDGKGNEYVFNASIQDSALAFSANGKATLNDSSKNITTDVRLKQAALHKMHLIEKHLTIAGDINLNADFVNADDLTTNLRLSNLRLAKNDLNYHIKEVKLAAAIRETYTNFDFTSDILSASLSGNTKISELKTAFNNHLDNYIQIPDSLLSEKEFEFDFELKLNKPEFFTDFLIEDLETFSIEKFQANYNGKTDLFEVDIAIPEVSYGNMDMDDLSLVLTSSKDSVKSDFKITQFAYDSATIRNFTIKSNFHDQKAEFLLNVHDHPDTIKYRAEIQLAFDQGAYSLHLNPDNLIINKQAWTSDQNNNIHIKDKTIAAENANISNGNQKIWITSTGENLKINFQNFNIMNITHVLEAEQTLVNGEINGYVDAVDFFNPKRLKSALKIHELAIEQKNLGELSIELDATSPDTLTLSSNLKNSDNIVSINGKSILTGNNPKIEGSIKTNINEANAFSGFLEAYVSSLEGGLQSDLSIGGEVMKPLVNGQINFQKFAMAVKPANSKMTANGSISIKDNLIQFDDFKLTDSLNNQLAVKGNIQARDISDPEFGLSITSPEFMVINSPAVKDNPVVGKLLLGMDMQIKGKLSALVVNSAFTIQDHTDIMYIMPGKDLELISDKGVVTFEDYRPQSDSTSKENQFISDTFFSSLNASDISINLSIDPKARFRIYVDPNSGDITEFKLNGKLNYKYTDTQRGRLTGLVELTEGYYELSFYGLVKKKFVYDPGSTITWSGDIMEGNIDLTARYEVKTNSVGLVSNEISGYEKSMYNQRLPYQVLLHINQEISNPVFSFNIELPDRYTSEQPILESKLNMLNQENNASDLNKQVFALLVGGTFIPDNPDVNEGSGSNSFATTAARNSVNAMMTQQLNNLTGQFIKGVDVEMGVNTFENYASGKPQTQTQLDVKVSKNLFNNRISAEVESHINLDGSTQTSTLGQTEFAVSYQLTESGNYLIKAFRENAWDIFDGEIQNSGIALIFVKEFDSFKSDKDNLQHSDSTKNPIDPNLPLK